MHTSDLTADEVEIIERRRKEQQKKRDAIEFQREAIGTAMRFAEWSERTGYGLTFSTFVNQFKYQHPEQRRGWAPCLAGEENIVSRNRELLARMLAMTVVERARCGPQPSEGDRLMAAVEDAISDGRRRRDLLEAGTKAYLEINDQIARWEAARRANR